MINFLNSAIFRAIQPMRTCWLSGGLFFLLIISLVIPSVVVSAEFQGLYEAEVLVTSQGVVERNEAIRAALDEVLIRVSGDRNTPRAGVLQGLYKRSLQLVQQYRYRALPLQAGQSGEQGLTQVLWVSFDPLGIDQALRKAGVPLWGQTRPATLVWVVVDERGKRSLMGAETLQQPKKVMQRQAERRGLPLIVPLWDREDQRKLRLTDVWGNFQDNIFSASTRYATDAVLVGRLFYQTDGVWEGRWSLYQGGQTDHWRTVSPRQAEVLSAGVDGTADLLGRRFAKVFDESQSSRVKMTIKDVNTLEDYARVTQFLRSLDVVTALQVERVADAYVTFDLQLRGDSNGLAQTISFGRTLLETPAVINLDDLNDPLQMLDEAYDLLWYRLAP